MKHLVAAVTVAMLAECIYILSSHWFTGWFADLY